MSCYPCKDVVCSVVMLTEIETEGARPQGEVLDHLKGWAPRDCPLSSSLFSGVLIISFSNCMYCRYLEILKTLKRMSEKCTVYVQTVLTLLS